MAKDSSSLRRIKCASADEIKGWLVMHLRTSQDERAKPIVATFCGDCRPDYETEMRGEGRCIRKKGWR